MQNQSESNQLPTTLFLFIWHYLKNRKLYLLGFFIVALVWAIEMSLSPYLLKVIIDAVVQDSQNQTKLISAIFIPAILYVSMSIILNATFRLYDYINLRLNPEIMAAVNIDMFSSLLRHSYTFFQNNFSGSLTRKIFDMTNIVQLISIFNEFFYPRIFAMLISSITLFIVVKPIFGIILFTWSVLFVIFSYVSAKNSEKLAREISEVSAKLGGTMADSVANVMNTKLFSNIPNEIEHVKKDVHQMVFFERKLQWKNLHIYFAQECGVTVLIASMLSALIYGRIHGWVTAGDFALVLMLSMSFIRSVRDIGQQMLKFSKMIGVCNQSLSFLRVPYEILDAEDAKPIAISQGKIIFQDVSFHYENNNTLFEKLDITINPGEKVGLVGYSGGGKSTFIKLILRLMDPQSGCILIDGYDIKKVTKHSLRKQIGTIPQEPDLFHRTIMENIRFARSDASDEDVIQAAKKARCDEFISGLPEGYQSLVGERGIKLSGGQKQRIAIARAFLKNAPILLLDEATSSLDSVTERYIQESLHEVMANKTTIVIAHRLSTLKDMDRILVFVSGKIVEDGALNVLLENKESHFYKLWNMQAQGFIPSITE